MTAKTAQNSCTIAVAISITGETAVMLFAFLFVIILSPP